MCANNADRAVSPVIGVILMVAITVMLSVVVAQFVFSIGVSNPTPQASITVDESENEAEIRIDSIHTADGVAVVDSNGSVVGYSETVGGIIHVSNNQLSDNKATIQGYKGKIEVGKSINNSTNSGVLQELKFQ